MEFSGADELATEPPEIPVPHNENLGEINEDMFTDEVKEPTVEYSQNENAASSDLKDIAQFGNSHLSSTREGSLRYTILVAGIDTSDVREMFREALTDRKLVWDTDEILRSIKNGEVKLANISPAKAFIIVSRLKNLPVQVHWEQYAISQT